MPSALLAERDTAVPNRFFFSSNHPFCFLLLCFSMPHSVAYCVSLQASSWYFRHRKMMARSTVWLLRIHVMRVVVCPPTAWPVSNPRGERCTGATSFVDKYEHLCYSAYVIWGGVWSRAWVVVERSNTDRRKRSLPKRTCLVPQSESEREQESLGFSRRESHTRQEPYNKRTAS